VSLIVAARPVITYCDDATGERMDLDAAGLGGWVARTASLLRDGCGLGAGGRVAVLLPPHWQTAAVVLGAWSTGLTVAFRPWATAGLGVPAEDTAMDAVFVARNRVGSWLETVPEAPHRFVLGPGDEAPDGYRDYVAEVGRQPDEVPAYRAVLPDSAASTDGTTYQEWADLARGVASSLGLRQGDRILVDAALDSHPATWLLAPLTTGASIVICANRDRSRDQDRVAAEGITHVF